MLFMDAANDYIRYLQITEYSKQTSSGYYKQIKYFYRYLSSKYNCPLYIEDITISDIEDYLDFLKNKGDAACSRARFIYILRAFYNYMNKKKMISKNIPAEINTIKYTQKERVYLTEEELVELIETITHPIVRVSVQTIYYTGLRISECINLKTDDIDFYNNVIYVREGKGRKNRNIPMSNKLRQLLQEYSKTYRNCVESTYFFATKKTGSISACYINRIIGDAALKLGWTKKVSAHTLRHSFASNLVKHNVNIVSVQKLLGHSSLKSTSIYTHCSMEELYETVNLL